MSAVATPAPATPAVGPVRRLVRSLRPVADLLRPYRRLFVGGVLTNLMVHVCTFGAAVVGAILIGKALDGAPASELKPLVWVVIALALPIALFGWLEVVVVHVMSFRLIDDLRKELYDRFRILSPAYFLSRRSGDVARASMADVELLEVFTSHLAPPLVVAFVVPVIAVIGLWIVEPVLAVVVLPFVVAAASVPSWLLRRAQDEGEQLREELGELGANVVDVVQGTREVLAASAEDLMLERIGIQHDRIRATSISHGRRSGIEHAATDAIMSLAAIAVVSATALLTTGGSFDPAAIPVALILAAGAFAPLASLTGTLREVGQVSAAAERIVVLMDAEPVVVDRVDEAASASRRPPRDGSLRVAFDDVRFRYAADLPDVVRDVSFAVEPGETVALVGHSGAGKSTCANLLLRLWDVDAGAVRVGGTDIRDLLLHDLRPLIAVVPQDVYLFHTSVADNLRLGNPDAGEEQLERAARLAQATGFIELLPDGFETVLGERGASISGGQRQRLAIARALLRDAPILVMDEAVANLDAESEAALRDAMAEVARDRTTLLIAHRPSTIRTADRVVVLDHGRVVETGTYDGLLRSGGHLSALLAGSPAIVDPDA
jgi:ABC-type multidrug transport system fused ATPase/permease subunit